MSRKYKKRIFKSNEYKIVDDVAIIKLTKEKETIIDLEDLEKILKYKWCASKEGKGWYALTNIKTNYKYNRLRLHRFLMNITDSNIFIDHKDCNPLNNRKSNLRLCTNQENQRNVKLQKRNTTGFKGVYFRKDRNKYIAYTKCNGKNICFGSSETAEGAYEIYCKKIIEIHKEFSNKG